MLFRIRNRAKKISLGISKVTQTNIAPKELVAYNKETQTRPEQVEREGKHVLYFSVISAGYVCTQHF